VSKHRPTVVAFDVIETLFPLEPLKRQLKEAGLPGSSMEVWFARILRDAIALDLTGEFKSFREVAEATLQGILAEHAINPASEQVNELLEGFAKLPAAADVRPALDLLRSAGVRAIALTNGSRQNTEKLFRAASLDHLIEKVVSIDDVQRWKPAVAVYMQAVTQCGVETNQMALVAAHAWDIQGAHAAGLTTAWFPRQEKRFPQIMHQPDVKGATPLEVVEKLLSLPGPG
jgi:2-haloacid dehalogenase